MRVALLKPDFGSTGGFERLLADLRPALADEGVETEMVTIDATTPEPHCFGVRVSPGVRQVHHEYFQYLDNVARVDRLDLDRFDVVVASQPPTYLAPHDRVVAVFYHQARVFYDLADVVVDAGIVDAEIHAAASEQVRAIDLARLGGVRTWLAGSEEVAARLRTSWDVPTDRIRPFRAVPPPPRRPPAPYDPAGPAVVVSRHTWTKRTELAVQAAHLHPDVPFELVGGGDRLPWVLALDDHLRRHPADAARDDPHQTWCNRGTVLLPRRQRNPGSWGTSMTARRQIGPPERGVGRDGGGPGPGAIVHGEVDDDVRDDVYDRAGVVVAPAFREDYGLTVLEAFARGRPVIVCNDGGGLVELVEGTGAGLVVEPTASAIGRAVDGLRADPLRAAAMADAAASHQGPDPSDAVRTLVQAIGDAAP